MGFGAVFNRNIQIVETDMNTGISETFTIVTPENGMGAYPDWSNRSALSIPAVFRSVTLLADLIGSFPWHAYSNHGTRQNEVVPAQILDQPNPPETRASTISAMVIDYLLHGNAIGIYSAHNPEGYPTAVVPVASENVSVRWNEGRREYRIGDDTFDQDEIFHVKGPCGPGELRAPSRLELFFDTLNLTRDQQRAAKGASNSGVPTGLLKVSNPDATADDLRATKTGWMNAQATRTVAVLNATTDFEPLAWNPSEAQLLDARKFSIHEIGLIFGIPLSFLGVEAQSMTYENGEQKGLDLLKFSVGGILVRFEQEFSKALPRGTEAKANVDSLLRPDTVTRYTSHEIGIRAGFLTVNEARELENRAPLPETQEENIDEQ